MGLMDVFSSHMAEWGAFQLPILPYEVAFSSLYWSDHMNLNSLFGMVHGLLVGKVA